MYASPLHPNSHNDAVWPPLPPESSHYSDAVVDPILQKFLFFSQATRSTRIPGNAPPPLTVLILFFLAFFPPLPFSPSLALCLILPRVHHRIVVLTDGTTSHPPPVLLLLTPPRVLTYRHVHSHPRASGPYGLIVIHRGFGGLAFEFLPMPLAPPFRRILWLMFTRTHFWFRVSLRLTHALVTIPLVPDGFVSLTSPHWGRKASAGIRLRFSLNPPLDNTSVVFSEMTFGRTRPLSTFLFTSNLPRSPAFIDTERLVAFPQTPQQTISPSRTFSSSAAWCPFSSSFPYPIPCDRQ